MKWIYTLCLILTFTVGLFAQTAPPQGIPYQAVLIDKNPVELPGRDIANRYLSNQNLEVRFSILPSPTSSTTEYQETHNTTTDEYGLMNLIIGQGTPALGLFTSIKWENEPKYLQVEVKLQGKAWELFSVERLWSVPYALYTQNARYADSLKGGITDRDSQLLSIDGDSLRITNGNAVYFPRALDTSNTNELQDLVLSGDSLLITKGKGVLLPKDEDRDSTNELQDIFRNGDSLYLTLSFSKVDIRDSDYDSLNELQVLRKNGDTLFLSKANFVLLSDDDSLNEIQEIRLNQDSIYLTRNGGGISIDSITKRIKESLGIDKLNSSSPYLEQGCFPGTLIDLSQFCKGTYIPTIQGRISDSVYIVRDSIGFHTYNLKNKKSHFLLSKDYRASILTAARYNVVYIIEILGASHNFYRKYDLYSYDPSTDSITFRDSFRTSNLLNDRYLINTTKDLLWLEINSNLTQGSFYKYDYNSKTINSYTNPNENQKGIYYEEYNGDTLLLGSQLVNAQSMSIIKDLPFIKNSDYAAVGKAEIYYSGTNLISYFYDLKLDKSFEIAALGWYEGKAGGYLVFKTGNPRIGNIAHPNIVIDTRPQNYEYTILIPTDRSKPYKYMGHTGWPFSADASRYIQGPRQIPISLICVENKMIREFSCMGFHGYTGE